MLWYQLQILFNSIRMNHFSVVNLAILGAVVLLHLGVEADCSSSCSFPGLPGRDGIPGQQGRDGRDGSHGPVGPPGGQLGIHTFCMYTYVRMQPFLKMLHVYNI